MQAINLALPALALFAFVSSITPGPNNLLVMRSGARFGLSPTLWHIVGIELGFGGLVVLAYAGVGALFLALPAALTALRWACMGYLLYLAWQILRDPGPSDRPGSADARPMRVREAAVFQLVNPKAWMMAVTGVSAFNTAGSLRSADLAVVVLLFVGIGFPCVLVWALWGAAIHRVLHRPLIRRAFNVLMALLVVVSALWMLKP
jgi:threonine/homoserine/homoserine lactone efflux protein